MAQSPSVLPCVELSLENGMSKKKKTFWPTGLRLGLGFALITLAVSANAEETELHVGSHVFTAEASVYKAQIDLECPSSKKGRVGVSGPLEGASSLRLPVFWGGRRLGEIRAEGPAPIYWLDVELPAKRSTLEIRAEGLSGNIALRSSYIGLLLLDDEGCLVKPGCLALEGVSINCGGLERSVCEILRLEAQTYCQQLTLDEIAAVYSKYPSSGLEVWTVEHRAIYQRLAPRIEARIVRQQELYNRIERLSLKRPRQYKKYLEIHAQLERSYQKALGW